MYNLYNVNSCTCFEWCSQTLHAISPKNQKIKYLYMYMYIVHCASMAHCLILGVKGLNVITSGLNYTTSKPTVLFRYGIHLWDIGHTSMWEGRSTWCYNTDLMMDLAMYIVDFAHHLHMLVRNYWLTTELVSESAVFNLITLQIVLKRILLSYGIQGKLKTT